MMCNCSLAGTAACRTCSNNDQSFYSKINIISESLTQDGWLKLLKDGVELQSGESITLKAAESKPITRDEWLYRLKYRGVGCMVLNTTGSKTDNEKDKLNALYEKINDHKEQADRYIKSCNDSIKNIEIEKAHYTGISSEAEDLLRMIERLQCNIYPKSREKTDDIATNH